MEQKAALQYVHVLLCLTDDDGSGSLGLRMALDLISDCRVSPDPVRPLLLLLLCVCSHQHLEGSCAQPACKTWP